MANGHSPTWQSVTEARKAAAGSRVLSAKLRKGYNLAGGKPARAACNLPLLRATREGDLDTVDHLLEVGMVDVNFANQHGDTALILASYLGHSSIVALLLAASKRVIWVDTTPVPLNVTSGPPRHNRAVIAYNKAAAGVMQEFNRSIESCSVYAAVIEQSAAVYGGLPVQVQLTSNCNPKFFSGD